MKLKTFAVAVGIALVAAGAAQASTVVTVMTRNLYLGADLTPVIAAKTPGEFFGAVANAYDEAQATNFAGRMSRIADEIAVTRPDLVGLQEAAQWRTQSPADFLPILDAATDAGDFVQLLVSDLAARGLDYSVAADSNGYDVEGPGAFLGANGSVSFMDVRLTQHEVILARVGRGLSMSNAQIGQYSAEDVFGSALGVPIVLPWSWASVDVTKDGKRFRFASTHLDSNFGAQQRAQAQEFLSGPANTTLPLIWVGDFNSDAAATGATGVPPDTATHSDVLAAGFTDAWAATRPGDVGFTCCNAADLLNPVPTYDHRIDYVFTRGAIQPLLVCASAFFRRSESRRANGRLTMPASSHRSQ